jgi:tRNA (mo5U34)-methyltransferase
MIFTQVLQSIFNQDWWKTIPERFRGDLEAAALAQLAEYRSLGHGMLEQYEALLGQVFDQGRSGFVVAPSPGSDSRAGLGTGQSAGTLGGSSAAPSTGRDPGPGPGSDLGRSAKRPSNNGPGPIKPSDPNHLSNPIMLLPQVDPSGALVFPEVSEEVLQGLKPWRKGPYYFGPTFIDTEWRSDWKWNRISAGISNLAGRRVLDVGCGSGYHLWRMLQDGAECALGVEPFLLNVAQFFLCRQLLDSQGQSTPQANQPPQGPSTPQANQPPQGPVHPWANQPSQGPSTPQAHQLPPRTAVLPLTMEQLPANGRCFDTVFSMGVLYHRRSPFDHLFDLKAALRNGGELVLETLIIPQTFGQVLVPRDRYAKMRNVWFIPNLDELLHWLTRAGFQNPQVLDVTQTSLSEQRATPWMTFESLQDFLDPDDPSKTIEGYPAPLRACIRAESP